MIVFVIVENKQGSALMYVFTGLILNEDMAGKLHKNSKSADWLERNKR